MWSFHFWECCAGNVVVVKLNSHLNTLLSWYAENIFFAFRLYLAALHYNENIGRPRATTTAGQPQFKVTFPKAKKGEYRAREVKTQATFSMYNQSLLTYYLYNRNVHYFYCTFPYKECQNYLQIKKIILHRICGWPAGPHIWSSLCGSCTIHGKCLEDPHTTSIVWRVRPTWEGGRHLQQGSIGGRKPT